jgi:hypothetical protein
VRQRISSNLLLGVAVPLLLVLVACQPSASPLALPTTMPEERAPQPTSTLPPSDTPVEATLPPQGEDQEPGATQPAPVTAPALSLPTEAEPLVAATRTDLAQRLGVPEGEITVLSVEAVEWRDGSLGCPAPGMAYIQVITPGFRVILQVGGIEYEYHTDSRQSIVFCDEESMADLPVLPNPTESEPGTIDRGLEGLVNEAKEDLVARLSIPVGEIELLEARSVVWPDASLGCPQPDIAYAQVTQEGVLIRLSVYGHVYNYHSGESLELFLCQDKFKRIEPLPSLGND